MKRESAEEGREVWRNESNGKHEKGSVENIEGVLEEQEMN